MSKSKPKQNFGQSLLSQIDYASINEFDPSMQDNFRLLYDQEISYHIRFQEKGNSIQDLPNLETIKTRIFIFGDDKNPQQLKIELSSDNDLFFHFVHLANESTFRLTKQLQQLNIDFSDYAMVCIKNFNRCLKEPTFSAVFNILPEGMGKLEIIQATEYKNLEIIQFDFQASSEDLIKQLITFKYNCIKQKLSLMEGRLSDANEIIRVKNPSLLLQIQKNQQNLFKI